MANRAWALEVDGKVGIVWHRFALGLLLWVSLSACQAGPEPPGTHEIFRLLYGPEVKIQPELGGESEYAIRELSELERAQFGYTTLFETRLIYQSPSWQGDPRQFLVLTSSEPPECCTWTGRSVIGAAILIYQDGAWQIGQQQAALTYLGSLVGEPQIETLPLGPGVEGLRIQDLEIAGGVLRQVDQVIAPLETGLAVVARIDTKANNAGACPPASDEQPCWAYSASYAFMENQNAGFYDLEVTTTGSRLVQDEVRQYEERQVYFFDGAEYRPQE